MSRFRQLIFQNEVRVAEPRCEMDRFVPVYQFSEFHSTRVLSSAERVYRAIKEVTADEIFLFRTLTWIRRCGCSGPKSILNPPHHQPVLEVATESSFVVLAELPFRELVLGTVVVAPAGWEWSRDRSIARFQSITGPGFALAAMNFLIEEESGGCILSTETRIYCTDGRTRKKFGVYWRAIYPGSAFIRRMWLRAIVRRAGVT